MLKVFISSLLIFMHIFAFKVPLFYNSTIMAFFMSMFFINKEYFNNLAFVMKQKKVYVLLILFSVPFFYALLSTTFHNTYDFSYISIYLGNLVYFFMTISITCMVYSRLNSDIHPFLLLVVITVIQSCIIAFSFMSSSFLELVKLFQDVKQSEMASEYYGGNVRGLALAGGQFFNLSALFTMLLIVFVTYGIEFSKGKLYYLLFVFCFLCSLTTGRTVFVALPLVCFIFLMTQPKAFIRILLLSFSFVFVLTILFNFGFDKYLYLPESIKETFFSFSKFAFEFVYNYLNHGKLETASTNRLSEMFFLPSLKTIILGDGMYTGLDGRYYMHTDSGYMRNMLLFGLFGSLVFFIYEVYMIRFFSPLILNRTRLYFSISIILAFLILQSKGEVVAYLITVNIMMLFIYFSTVIKFKSNVN